MIGGSKHMRTSRGFSIVEALVALVVLSVGMLGIAALYVESLRAGRTAVYRTQAVNLAADMADRIRANRGVPNSWQLAANGNPVPPKDCVNGGVTCTPNELALYDQRSWLDAIRNELPSNGASLATGTITVDDAASPPQYEIKITWFEPGGDLVNGSTYILTMQT
jgi:type IV pilus assembly protein PilV